MQPHARVRVIYANGYDTSYLVMPDSADLLDETLRVEGVRPDMTYWVSTPMLEDGSVATWYITNAVSIGVIRPPELQFSTDLGDRYVHQMMGHA